MLRLPRHMVSSLESLKLGVLLSSRILQVFLELAN